MAVRYANFDLATGLNDGTSEANAWQTWAAVLAGETAGDHVWVKKTATRHNEGGANTRIDLAFFAPTVSELSRIEGYGTTIGDGVMFESSNRYRHQATAVLLKSFDILVDHDTEPVINTQQAEAFVGSCKIVQQGRAGIIGRGAYNQTKYGQVVNSHLERTYNDGGTATQPGVNMAVVDGCTVIDEKRGVTTTAAVVVNSSDGGSVLKDTTIRGPGSGTSGSAVYLKINPDCTVVLSGLSIADFDNAIVTDAGVSSDFSALVRRCAFEDVNYVMDLNAANTLAKFRFVDGRYASNTGVIDGYSGTQVFDNFVSIATCFVDATNDDFTPSEDLAAVAITSQTGSVNRVGAIQTVSASVGGGAGLLPTNFGLLPINKTSEVS